MIVLVGCDVASAGWSESCDAIGQKSATLTLDSRCGIKMKAPKNINATPKNCGRYKIK